MCGRFYVDDDMLEKIKQIVHEMDAKIKHEHFQKDIKPTDLAPILVQGNNGIKLTEQQWGYPRVNNKGIIFNARSETVMEKRIFHNGIYGKRAVIPVKHFYEWNNRKEKNIFKRKDNRTLYLAGFYDNFNGIDKFIILTTVANKSMIGTHPRMPLVLENNQLEDWVINNSKTEEILHQIPTLLSRFSEYEQQSFF